MRKFIVLIAVVGFGIAYLHAGAVYAHGGHDHSAHERAEKANEEKKQKEPVAVKVNPEEAPCIVFDSNEHDFGTVYSGDKVDHEFTFHNNGKGDLVIEKVKTSCGCTAAASTKDSIPPGDSGSIKTTFRAGRHAGNTKKLITVTTNDPVNSKIKLKISATIIQEVVLKPQWINFGNVSKGESSNKTIAMSPGTEDFNLEVTGVETQNQYVTATYKKHEDGKSYIIGVTIKEDAPIGRQKGKIIVDTNSSRQPKLFIPFSGKITGDVVVSRSVLSYGTVTRGRELVRKLIVTIRNKDVDVKDVEITPAFLSANLEPKADPELPYREVVVKLKSDAPVGKISGSIKIHTSSEIQPVIEIPVFGEVREHRTRKG